MAKECFLPVKVLEFVPGVGMEDAVLKRCGRIGRADCVGRCEFEDDGLCFDKPDDMDCPDIVHVPCVVLGPLKAVPVKDGDIIAEVPLFGKIVMPKEEAEKAFVQNPEQDAGSAYVTVAAKILEGHMEKNESKLMAYAESLADNLRKSGDEKGARIIEKRIDGSYLEEEKPVGLLD